MECIVEHIKRYVLHQIYPNRSWSHGGVEVFLSIFYFFAGWRISTNHRSKKEFSDQDWCTGWIVENIKRYVLNQNHPNWSRTHWVVEVFLFIFADFEDFNWPALQEGGVCSWSLYGMNYEGHRVLDFRRHRFSFTQEFMEIFRFFISILLILLIFLISTGQRFRKERSVHDNCMGSI